MYRPAPDSRASTIAALSVPWQDVDQAQCHSARHDVCVSAEYVTPDPDERRFVVHDAAVAGGASRFEMMRDGELVSFATYRIAGDDPGVVMIPHVETLPQHREQGFADRLMDGIVAIAREDGRTILPRCSFAAGYFHDRPEQGDVLPSDG